MMVTTTLSGGVEHEAYRAFISAVLCLIAVSFLGSLISLVLFQTTGTKTSNSVGTEVMNAKDMSALYV